MAHPRAKLKLGRCPIDVSINAVCIDPAGKQRPLGNLPASSQDLPPHGGVFLVQGQIGLSPFSSVVAIIIRDLEMQDWLRSAELTQCCSLTTEPRLLHAQ